MNNIQVVKGTLDHLTSVNGQVKILIFQIKKVLGCTPGNVHFENLFQIK